MTRTPAYASLPPLPESLLRAAARHRRRRAARARAGRRAREPAAARWVRPPRAWRAAQRASSCCRRSRPDDSFHDEPSGGSCERRRSRPRSTRGIRTAPSASWRRARQARRSAVARVHALRRPATGLGVRPGGVSVAFERQRSEQEERTSSARARTQIAGLGVTPTGRRRARSTPSRPAAARAGAARGAQGRRHREEQAAKEVAAASARSRRSERELAKRAGRQLEAAEAAPATRGRPRPRGRAGAARAPARAGESSPRRGGEQDAATGLSRAAPGRPQALVDAGELARRLATVWAASQNRPTRVAAANGLELQTRSRTEEPAPEGASLSERGKRRATTPCAAGHGGGRPGGARRDAAHAARRARRRRLQRLDARVGRRRRRPSSATACSPRSLGCRCGRGAGVIVVFDGADVEGVRSAAPPGAQGDVLGGRRGGRRGRGARGGRAAARTCRSSWRRRTAGWPSTRAAGAARGSCRRRRCCRCCARSSGDQVSSGAAGGQFMFGASSSTV